MIGRKYEKEERMAYIEEFKKAHQSLNSFAKKKDIPVTTLRQWMQSSGISGNKSVKFGNIKPSNISDITTSNVNENMTFVCDHIRIELQKNFNKALLRKIVEVLLDA